MPERMISRMSSTGRVAGGQLQAPVGELVSLTVAYRLGPRLRPTYVCSMAVQDEKSPRCIRAAESVDFVVR